jgi:hypothetical protein
VVCHARTGQPAGALPEAGTLVRSQLDSGA